MSDNWLQYVPLDPEFVPTELDAEAARTLFSKFAPNADEISLSFKQHVEFFHPGANWSGVTCPLCDADVEAWWTTKMEDFAAGQLPDLLAKTNCCRTTVSLNELRYVWPAGFGRFVLEAMNPNLRGLSVEQESQLEEVLGCKLRAIWMHV
ncbi:hypothetical protein ACQUJV_24220 [Ralstonia pseudosolanacearum]